MTIRMQESEAAENFSRFLAHLKAGDQVQLECEGKPSLIAEAHTPEEPPKSPPRGSLEAAHSFFKEWGPMLADEEYVRAMKEAREVFSEPLKLRPGWE